MNDARCGGLVDALDDDVGGTGAGSWHRPPPSRRGLVDDDVIALSNINRQLPATMRTIGRAKTDVLRERFLDINPSLEINALCTLMFAATMLLVLFSSVIGRLGNHKKRKEPTP